MIELRKVKKVYGNKGVKTVALNGIDLKIEAGEFVSIMGRSGCGKTTLLNILGCIDKFDEGEYLFEGADVTKLTSNQLADFRNKKLGFVFQSFNLVDGMTVLENVEIPLGYAGIPNKRRKEIASEMLKKVGLSDKAGNYPGQMSGGQQQRVAIARALANNPRLVLADEPTGNLDTKSGAEIMDLLQNLNKSGTTLVLVTHDNTVSSYASREILLEDGRIVSDSNCKQGICKTI
jgi:putative ABC transport system ATP-binding protein